MIKIIGLNEIFVGIGILIMVLNIRLLIKNEKILLEIIERKRTILKYVIIVKLILLIAFTVGYIFTFGFMIQFPNQFIETIVGQILFWGSIFVSVTLYLEKQLGSTLITERLAQTDSMTGLLNKAALRKNAEIYLKENKVQVAVIMIDIDNFKKVNDIYGHLAGDEVIKDIAKIIRNTVDIDYLTGRFGGDEFVIFAKNATRENLLPQINEIKERIVKCGRKYPNTMISSSIGIIFSNDKDSEYDKLLQYADEALYKAKQAGKNKYIIYNNIVEEKIHLFYSQNG